MTIKGDAPVLTYYVALMLKKSQVHYFSNFYYRHGGGKNFIIQNETCISQADCNIFWHLNI